MKKVLIILLVILIAAAGTMTTEYMKTGRLLSEAYADTSGDDAQETLYVLTEEGASGIRRIPYENFHFKNWDLMAEIEWYFTPEEVKILTFMSLEQKIGQLYIRER